jgi:hypothetical protein
MEISGWHWVALGLSVLILITGFITARGLSEPGYISHVRKFAAGAAIPVIVLLLFPRPFVWEFSVLDAVSSEPPGPTQDIAQTVTQQSREIRTLQTEVKRLRTQLVQVNDYYGRITTFLLTTAITACVLYTLRRRREDIEPTDGEPLGLNNDDNK